MHCIGVIEFMKPKTGEASLEDLIESPSKQQTTTEIDLDTGDEETLDIVQAKLKKRTVAPPESPEVKAERAHAMWMAGFMYMNGLGTVNSERHPEKVRHDHQVSVYRKLLIALSLGSSLL